MVDFHHLFLRQNTQTTIVSLPTGLVGFQKFPIAAIFVMEWSVQVTWRPFLYILTVYETLGNFGSSSLGKRIKTHHTAQLSV